MGHSNTDAIETRPNNDQLTGVLFILGGALGFSAKAVLVKMAFNAQANLDVITLMTVRMGLALPFFLLIALVSNRALGRKTAKPLDLDTMVPVMILGLLGYYAASYLDFWALMLIPAGLERAILFTYPTIVVVLSALIYKTRISGRTALALFISYGGIILAFSSYATLSSASNYENLLTGSLIIFIAAIIFAIFTLGSVKLIHSMGSIQFTAWSMTIACVATLIHFSITNNLGEFHISLRVFYIAAVLAIFSTVIPSFLIAGGIKRIGANSASIINSTGPMITIVLGYYFLGEQLAFNQFAGIAMVITGAVLVSKK